jgi:acyl carrier protein
MIPTGDELWKRVRKVMAETLAVPEDEIELDTTPDAIPEWDSAMHVNLVLALEQELGLRFTPADAAEMLSAELIYLIVRERSVA